MSKNKNLFAIFFINLLLVKFSDAATAPSSAPGPNPGKISGAPGETTLSQSQRPENISTNAPTEQHYNPAGDNLGLYSGLPTQMPEGLTQAPETFWQRDTLLGDLWGARNK